MTKPFKIITGDCLERLARIEDGSVDAVFADPPYSSGGFTRGDRMAPARSKYSSSDQTAKVATFTGDNRDQRAYLAWSTLWMSRAREVTKTGGILGVFADWRQLPITTDAVQCAGWLWRGIVVWAKANARPQPGRYIAQSEFMVWATNGPRELVGDPSTGVFYGAAPVGSERVHITQKPVDVMRGILQPVPVGGLVLDPFAGSGTTGVACMLEKRRFVGIELDPGIAATARSRIEKALCDRDQFVTRT